MLLLTLSRGLYDICIMFDESPDRGFHQSFEPFVLFHNLSDSQLI